MSYSSTTESQKRCIICNEEKKEKGRIVPLTMIEMRENDTKKHYYSLQIFMLDIRQNTRRLLKEFYSSLQHYHCLLLMCVTIERNVICLSGGQHG